MMTKVEALRAIESLRKGIPPDGQVSYFTVGRTSEIEELEQRIQQKASGVLLVCANYGSGKSHLLRLIREMALAQNYLVSMVSLDCRSAVRFNRLDQILGAVCRSLELRGSGGQTGPAFLLDYVADRVEQERRAHWPSQFWSDLSNKGRWSRSEVLGSRGLYVAVRAWLTADADTKALVTDWLLQPKSYQTQRKRLYHELVGRLRPHFLDPRPEWQFYSDEVFIFDKQDYDQSWDTLQDLHTLSLECGLNGLVILFDEVEDLYNLNNVKYEQKALDNLFRFFDGRRFHGMSYFGVTPDFTEKCKKRLLEKGLWDYDYSRFDELPKFSMSPLDAAQLNELSLRIMETHGRAYDWEPDMEIRASELRRLVEEAARVAVEDRVRLTVTHIVRLLDDRLEEAT